MSIMLIGIAGPTASGKTTVAARLERDHGARRLRYSEILAEIARERGLDPDDKETLQDLFTSIRDERGEDWLTVELKERAVKIDNPMLVIEGNRRRVDLETLKDVAKARQETLHFIFIDAGIETRRKRYNERMEAQGDPTVTLAEFTELETDPAEDEVNLLRDLAKTEGVYIDTDTYTVDETMKIVEKLLKDEV